MPRKSSSNSNDNSSDSLIIDLYRKPEDNETLRKLLDVANKFRGEVHIHDHPEYDVRQLVSSDAAKRLPFVVYSLGKQKRFEFEGPYTVVSYLWKAVDVLRPSSRVRPPKRRRRGDVNAKSFAQEIKKTSQKERLKGKKS